jgi:hypothetical protein
VSTVPATVRVHQLLAESHPEPLDAADLERRLALPRRIVEFALSEGVRSGLLQRGRPMAAPCGYSYTVAAA